MELRIIVLILMLGAVLSLCEINDIPLEIGSIPTNVENKEISDTIIIDTINKN